MMAHRNYRRAVDAGQAQAAPFRMPGAPYANWAVLIFLLIVTAMLSRDPDTRVALYVAPLWFGLLGVGYLRTRPRAATA
jgi:L-asparagine transporter-like permease